MMKSFEVLLEEAVAYHGHLCAGQILGVRISMAALRWLGITEPKKYRNLIVYVEIDRCATDAIHSVTGCKLGRRTLKHVDYGKMAATFVDLNTRKAIRVWVPEGTRELAKQYCPDSANPYLDAYRIIPDEELLRLEEVVVTIAPEDLPGKPVRRVMCSVCGEGINDAREVMIGDRCLCRGCVGPDYYRPAGKAEDQNPEDISVLAREKAQTYHQAGLNAGQAVIQALTDFKVIPNLPGLIPMLAAWRGGTTGGGTCAAFAAGELVLGLLKTNPESAVEVFKRSFLMLFGSTNCRTLTTTLGNRESPERRRFCDHVCGMTAAYLADLPKTSPHS